MTNKEKVNEIEDLKKQIAELKADLDNLREFVKGLYAMMDGENQYTQADEMLAPDFRGINT